MHIITKAMKLFSLPLICIIILPSLFAFQAHDQNLGYTHPAIVVKDGVSYISAQTVPAGTPITSSSYWTPLLSTAPTDEPGDPPTTEPDTSDSDLGNLTPPDDNVTEVTPSPLINISTNGYALTGAEKMSAGFIITGSEPMNVYIKAEKSQEAGITPLSDPKMEIWNISRTEKIAENDNWGDHENLSSIQSLDPGYYPIEPTDSAVFLTLQPGAYLADVYGSKGNTGKALVAVNDVDDQSASQLINISTNGYAYTGSEKMTAGFIITEAQKVYIKAEKSQEAGITPLSNPKMEIWDLARTTKIAENDDWNDNSNINEILDLPSHYYPIEPTDSAVYITLQPGAYLADVYGAQGNSGKALIAVNKID
jgi:hypothetical protein